MRLYRDNDCPPPDAPPSRQGRSRIARPFMGGHETTGKCACRHISRRRIPANKLADYSRASLTGRGRRERRGVRLNAPRGVGFFHLANKAFPSIQTIWKSYVFGQIYQARFYLFEGYFGASNRAVSRRNSCYSNSLILFSTNSISSLETDDL